jgi:hypothetical protein
MKIKEMTEQEIADYYLIWFKKSPINRQVEEFFRKALHIKSGQGEDVLALRMEKIQESIRPIVAKAFAVAVKQGNLSISPIKLMGDEGVKEHIKQFGNFLGLPPFETLPLDEQESIVSSVKRQFFSMNVGNNITVGNIVQDIDKAIEIAGQLKVSFQDMLSDKELIKLYFRQRFNKEDFLRKSKEQSERFILTMTNSIMSQLELMPATPNLPLSHPGYAKAMRQIERRKKLVLYQTKRRAKKLRRISNRSIRLLAKEIY